MVVRDDGWSDDTGLGVGFRVERRFQCYTGVEPQVGRSFEDTTPRRTRHGGNA